MDKQKQMQILNYFETHTFAESYIKGIMNDGKIAINNVSNPVEIDFLINNIKTKEDLEMFIKNPSVFNEKKDSEVINQNSLTFQSEPQENVEQVVDNNNIVENTNQDMSTAEEIVQQNSDLSVPTLEDVKMFAEDLKDLNGLNNIIKSFALNEAGSVDIDKALSTVMHNTMNEAVKCIDNKVAFDPDLKEYSVDGKYNGNKLQPSSETNEIILKSFENLKIYIDASKLYGKNYSVDQIKEEYAKRINTMLADKNRLDNLNKPTEQKTEVKVEETPILQDNNISNEPQLKQSGFADVLVLSMIILVHAAIIINLIIKIKHI
jgi:hypothetical protein